MTTRAAGPAPEPRGPRIVDQSASCLRQVHPANLHGGRLTRVAFEVKEWDGGLLSVSSSLKTTPQRSFEHYTTTLGMKSAAVYAVTVKECEGESLGVFEDPETNPPDDAHAVIDFRSVTQKALKKAKETTLARLADQRGAVYQPAPPGD